MNGRENTVIIVSGERGSGKTFVCERIAAGARGMTVGGILCPGIFSGGEKTGCRVRDVSSGTEAEFGSNSAIIGGISWNRWTFSETAVEFANLAVRSSVRRGDDLVILDEAGPMELVDRAGLRPSLELLSSLSSGAGKFSVVVTVRPSLAAALGALFPSAIHVPVGSDPGNTVKTIAAMLEPTP